MKIAIVGQDFYSSLPYINMVKLKGHNWGLCRKCAKIHDHPRGMKGKKHTPETLEKMRGRTAWNKGLVKETDERVANYGQSVAESWKRPERQIHKMMAGDRLREGRNKYIKDHPEHQAYAGHFGGLKSIKIVRQKMVGLGYLSEPQKQLFELVKMIYPEAIMEYPVFYGGGKGRTKFLDVAVPSLKLDFEYDSEYFHDDESDRERDKILIGLGWKTIRINKETLNKIMEGMLKFESLL